MKMKIIIAGSRSFTDYEELVLVCDHLLSNLDQEDIEIVSGCASGADRLGEEYAKDNDYRLTKFPADWEKYGRSAGYLRNRQMAEYADMLIAFWDTNSSGTKNMIQEARMNNLKIRIHIF
jgi:hypothetical protein